MSKLQELLKKFDSNIGIYCKSGAWLVLGLGIIHIMFTIFTLWTSFNNYWQYSSQVPGDIQNASLRNIVLLGILGFIVEIAVIIAGFLVLYTLGAIACYLLEDTADNDGNEAVESSQEAEI